MQPVPKSRIVAIQAVVLYGLWPFSAVAAQVTLGSSLAAVPLVAWMVVFGLSTVFGLGSLLNRLKDETPPRLKTYIAAQMVSSWLAGGLTFLACESAGWSDLTETIAIALAAYAGATAIDRMSINWLNRVLPGERNAAKGDATTE